MNKVGKFTTEEISKEELKKDLSSEHFSDQKSKHLASPYLAENSNTGKFSVVEVIGGDDFTAK